MYHNNFFTHPHSHGQVYTENSVNVWDDGYPSGGNYWSDYTGDDNFSDLNQDQPDSDGIGDTALVQAGFEHVCTTPEDLMLFKKTKIEYA